MRYGAEYGYGGAEHGYGAEDFVSIYDALPAPESLWSVARRLRRAYTGPVIRVRRSSDNAEQDFYGSGASGLVSPDAIRSFNGWNLFAYTEDLSNAYWTKDASAVASIDSNAATDPLGGNTADRVNFINQTDTDFGLRRDLGTAVVAGRAVTFSCWLKGEGADIGKTIRVRLKRSTGTLVLSFNDVVLTGDWQRVFVTANMLADNVGIACNIVSLTGYALSALVWGMQVEVGTSTPTTYEPRTTTGAGSSFLVTRYDQSGNARHATQATTTLQPIVCESGVPVTNSGGRLTSKHVAADARRLAVASSTSIYNFLHTTGGTVLAIATANDTAAAKLILSSASSSTGAGIRISRGSNEVYGVSTGRLDVAGVATAGNSIVVNHSGSNSTSNTILISQVDPDNGTAASRALSWGNGTALSTTNAEAGTPFVENASDNMTIGATAAGGSAFDGTIGDVGIWSVFFSEAERKLVEADQGRFNSITVAP